MEEVSIDFIEDHWVTHLVGYNLRLTKSSGIRTIWMSLDHAGDNVVLVYLQLGVLLHEVVLVLVPLLLHVLPLLLQPQQLLAVLRPLLPVRLPLLPQPLPLLGRDHCKKVITEVTRDPYQRSSKTQKPSIIIGECMQLGD